MGASLHHREHGLLDRTVETGFPRAPSTVGLKAKAKLLDDMGTTLGAPPTEEHAASLVADILALGRNW